MASFKLLCMLMVVMFTMMLVAYYAHAEVEDHKLSFNKGTHLHHHKKEAGRKLAAAGEVEELSYKKGGDHHHHIEKEDDHRKGGHKDTAYGKGPGHPH